MSKITFAAMAVKISELIGEDFTWTNGKLGKEIEPIARKALISIRKEMDSKSQVFMEEWNHLYYYIREVHMAAICYPEDPLRWTDSTKKKEVSDESTHA